MKHFFDNLFLSIGFTSLGFYEAFGAMSAFCKMALPITGVASFFIYVLINIDKIFTGIYNIVQKIKTIFK